MPWHTDNSTSRPSGIDILLLSHKELVSQSQEIETILLSYGRASKPFKKYTYCTGYVGKSS